MTRSDDSVTAITDWNVRRSDCRPDERCVCCEMEMGDTHLPTCYVPHLPGEAVSNGGEPCPRGGEHRLAWEEGSAGVPYRYCEKCGAIFDENPDENGSNREGQQ